MQKFKEKVHDELYLNIIPFWSRQKDEVNGGFIGHVDNDGKQDIYADKGSMLQLRISWFFAKLYHFDKKETFKALAEHAFDYVLNHMIDLDGGIVWATNYKGECIDDTKHLYYQSFGLYAASQYHQSFKDEASKKLAHQLFDYIETHFKDSVGYREQFSFDENRIADLGIKADRTMNALLHLVEAYTLYYQVFKEAKAKIAIKALLDLFKDKIYNVKESRLEVLFDHDMNSVFNYQSYGHDIEASWLLDLAAKSLDEPIYEQNIYRMTDRLCQSVYQKGLNRLAIKKENVDGIEDDSHIWWIQAEGILGFYKNAKRSRNQAYFDIAFRVLEYIQNYQRNEKVGEWYWRLDKDNQPDLSSPLVSNWKCPYHNGRMCIELLEELSHE